MVRLGSVERKFVAFPLAKADLHELQALCDGVLQSRADGSEFATL